MQKAQKVQVARLQKCKVCDDKLTGQVDIERLKTENLKLRDLAKKILPAPGKQKDPT